MNVLDCQYGFGIKGQGQINLKSAYWLKMPYNLTYLIEGVYVWHNGGV